MSQPPLPNPADPPPERGDDFFLAERAEADLEPELNLAPPEGKSSAEIQRELAAAERVRRQAPEPPAIENEAETALPAKFTLADLFLITTCCAVGLAGGTWIRPDIFAGTLGLATLVIIPLFYVFGAPPLWIRRLWMTTLSVYLMASLAAVVRVALEKN